MRIRRLYLSFLVDATLHLSDFYLKMQENNITMMILKQL